MNAVRYIILFVVVFLAFVNSSFGQDTTYQLKNVDFGLMPVGALLSGNQYSKFIADQNSSNHDWLNNEHLLAFFLTEAHLNNRFNPQLDKISSYITYGLPVLMLAVAAKYPNKGSQHESYFMTGVNDALLFGELLFWERSIVMWTKRQELTPRPYVYNLDVSREFVAEQGIDAFRSFYSAHTSLAFTNALYWSKVIQTKKGVSSKMKKIIPIALYTAAGAVGVMRYVSGQHYVKDVVGGAIIGSSVAWLHLRIHRRIGKYNRFSQ